MDAVITTPARVCAASVPARIPTPRCPLDDATWPLQHNPEAPRAARDATRMVLDAWHMDTDTADSVVLVVSELVTNAVEHAKAPLSLHLHHDIDDSVWVGVSDGGPTPHDGLWTRSCAADEHGRGLAIVDALTTAHGAHTHQTGTTHWARLLAAA